MRLSSSKERLTLGLRLSSIPSSRAVHRQSLSDASSLILNPTTPRTQTLLVASSQLSKLKPPSGASKQFAVASTPKSSTESPRFNFGLRSMKSLKSSSDRSSDLTSKDPLTMQKVRWEEIKTPLIPSEVILLFGETIPPWEQREMENYSEIYFIGKNFKPKDPEFHDEQGDYKVLIKDHIAFRYEVVALIGKGSFGQVLEVLDHKTKKSIALKVVKNLPKFHQQAKIEVDILKFIKEFDTNKTSNIIEILESFTFRGHIVIFT
jgi:hypothetical protein